MHATQLTSSHPTTSSRRAPAPARQGRPLLVATVVGAAAIVAVAVVTSPLHQPDRVSSDQSTRPATTSSYSAHHTNP